jgi:hypothetical protein
MFTEHRKSLIYKAFIVNKHPSRKSLILKGFPVLRIWVVLI